MRMLENFRPLAPFYREKIGSVLFGLACLIAVDFLQLYVPRIIKRAVDGLSNGTADMGLLIRCGVAIAGIAAAIAVFRLVWRILIFGHARVVEKKLRTELYGRLQTLSLPFYQRTRTGDLMARAVNDIEAVRLACGMGVVAFVDGLVMGLAAIGFMLAINVRLTLIALIPMPLIVIVTRKLSGRIHNEFKTVQKIFSDITEHVREAFAGIRVIKAYNRDEWQRKRVEEAGEGYIRANMTLARSMGLFFPTMVLFTNVSLAIVVWLGGSLAILGTITTGDFVAFMSYLNLLAWPMMAMGWVITLIQRGSASMGRIASVLSEVPDIADTDRPVEVEGLQGAVEARGLTFRYPEQTQPALKDVSLTIEPDATVCLVGGTGSGKTTFLELIPRLKDPPPETLFIDGVDIRRIPLKTLRKHIGYVPQESFLFSDTLRNNLTLGRDGISEDELDHLLSVAAFREEVSSFPHGLDTMLGEKGMTLSGGQRQRLTIARALVDDPTILILDDSLSSVDTQTERAILNGLLELRRGKLTIIVSHRVSAMVKAQKIFVFKDGTLIEQGSHEELIKKGEEYTRLYQRQLLEQELEEAA